MDAAFRKLWMRSKSKGGNSQQKGTLSDNSSRSRSRPSFSTVGDGRPSTAISANVFDRSRHADTLGSPRDFVSVTSDEYARPKSGHRIQPMLVGISRPAGSSERPGTAGSFQYAVQQAADTVGSRDLNPPRSQGMPVISHKHTRTKSPGYVDIFAVTNTSPTQSSKFNEEIAERNLDTLRVAMVDEQPYVPTSRYQEEVANRNLTYASRSSIDHARSYPNHTTSRSLKSREGQDVTSPLLNGLYMNQQPDPFTVLGRPSQDHGSYHSRQYSQQSRNEESGLVTTRQNHLGNSLMSKTLNLTPVSSVHTQQQASRVPYSRPGMQTVVETSNDVAQREPNGVSSLQTIDTGYKGPNNLAAEYQAIGSEPHLRVSTKRADTRHKVSDYGFERKKHMDPSVRSISANSNNSYVKGIGYANRVIMDFTVEDDFVSEMSSMDGYSQYSPVVEDAKVTSIRGAPPVKTSTYNKVTIGGSEGTGKDGFSASADSTSQQSPAIQKEQPKPRLEASTTMTSDASNTAIKFSPITTMASLAPRATIYIQKEEPMTMVQRAAAALEARNIDKSPGPARTPGKGLTMTKPVENIEKLPERRSSTPSTPKASVFNQPKNQQVDQAKPPSPSFVVDARTSGKEQTAESQEVATTKSVSRTPIIYDSPQSLESIDFANPGNAFGIKTRDFAVTPRKSTGSLRNKESQSLQKSATENAAKAASQSRRGTPSKAPKAHAQRNTPAARKVASGEFDEEAFARKQAEARAALIRLQQSLKEDFTILPDPVPRKSRVGESDPDRRSIGSTSSAQPKRTSASQLLGSRSDAEPPPSSFKMSQPGDRTSTSSARSRSGGRTPKKGVPPTLKNVEAGSKPISASHLSPALLLALQSSSKPPPSPGEISLSSFPLPSSRPVSEHEQPSSSTVAPQMVHRVRCNSIKSQTSLTSQFSIPFNMIPDRSSSVRDTIVEKEGHRR